MNSADLLPKIYTCFEDSTDDFKTSFYENICRSALERAFFGKQNQMEKAFLPALTIEVWGQAPFYFNLQLICPFRPHAAKFFQEMVSRGLLPGGKLFIESFFSVPFLMPDVSPTRLLLTEATVRVSSDRELQRIKRNLMVLEREIFLGIDSLYQSGRILEVRGMSASEKQVSIQEILSLVVQKRSQYFEYDLFSLMQHFFLNTSELFKQSRDSIHLSRIIYTSYLFKLQLSQYVEKQPTQRQVILKLNRVKLHLPFRTKRVLGILVGLNFINRNELFNEKHLFKSIKNYFPSASIIDDSLLVMSGKDEKFVVIYLEIQNPHEDHFGFEDLGLLRQRLPSDMKNNVERLLPAIFMPRNEEEVMKNILVLSQELKYFKDIPQVIISFEQQEEDYLSFTVIYLRLLPQSKQLSIQEMYRLAGGQFLFTEDRVKKVGMLRNKRAKEATVFRLCLPKFKFLREDHTVDMIRARQSIVSDLQDALGDFRDYNGGMIGKQSENLFLLKGCIGNLDARSNLLLENFFYSLMPMEVRNVVDLKMVKEVFLALREMTNHSLGDRIVLERERFICSLSKTNECFSEELVGPALKKKGVSSSQYMYAHLLFEDSGYYCSLLVANEEELRSYWKGLIGQKQSR